MDLTTLSSELVQDWGPRGVVFSGRGLGCGDTAGLYTGGVSSMRYYYCRESINEQGMYYSRCGLGGAVVQ